jgi:RNA polymerase sigma-70 factor (ECF subfamily)
MRVVLGWSLEEIAAHTRVPVNTVRSRLRLAKEAMRRRIEADSDLVEALEIKS